MLLRNGVTYEFHHLGIPTVQPQPGERYSQRFGMYTSDSSCRLMHIQWHRFTADSCVDPLVQSLPHPAFKVASLERAVMGCKLLLGPYEPIAGYRVAIIEDGGMPIEFIETTLTDEEVWGRAGDGKQTSIYGEAPSAEL